MQTRRLNISLMEEQQINKELIFNESIVKLDSMMNIVIEDFIDAENHISPYSDLAYIINAGPQKNHIIYKNINTKNYQYFLPQSEFIIYIKSKSNFYIFHEGKWRELGHQDTNAKKYNDVAEYYDINGNTPEREYLHLNGNTKITLSKISFPQLTLIIKQNYEAVLNVEWRGNILFPSNFKPDMKLKQNSFNVFTFYSIPHENHCLMLFSLNYQY